MQCGAEGAQSLGNTRALKPTNGILIVLKGKKKRKKKVIFNHEVLTYSAEWLDFCLSCPYTFIRTHTFNSTVIFNRVCSYDNPSICPLGAELTAPQGV